MSDLFKPETIYIFLLLIIPGVISQLIFNSLVARGKEKNVDVYHYVLHSIAVYMILYPIIVLFCGTDTINRQSIEALVTSERWRPAVAVLVILFTSASWGIAYSNLYRSKSLRTILSRFGEAYEPPNLYAALMVEKYQGDHLGSSFWITLKKDDYYIEGRVENVAVEKEPREIFISGVAYLNDEREVIEQLDPDTGLMIHIDKFDLIEITEIRPTNNV